MIIDSHQHLWDPARGDYDWLAVESPLHRAFLPADYANAARGSGICASLLVQAAPTAAETEYLLELARTSANSILGVVGWIDLSAPDAESKIEERARDPLFVGVRPMLQDLADRAWILRPELDPAIRAIIRHELTFDALVQPDQLATIYELAMRYAGLRIVLDHAGKPPFGGAMDEWSDQIRRIAGLSNVACKLSGLATELPPDLPADRLDDCIDVLIASFGAERLIWGSDWPVVTMATSLNDWMNCCTDRVARHLPDGAAAIFGGNARHFYRLGPALTSSPLRV